MMPLSLLDVANAPLLWSAKKTGPSLIATSARHGFMTTLCFQNQTNQTMTSKTSLTSMTIERNSPKKSQSNNNQPWKHGFLPPSTLIAASTKGFPKKNYKSLLRRSKCFSKRITSNNPSEFAKANSSPSDLNIKQNTLNYFIETKKEKKHKKT